MARNEFLFAWMMMLFLLLLAIMAVTGFFVWKSGILSGEVPLVESTPETGLANPGLAALEKESGQKRADSFNARIFCVDPATMQLVPEDRSIAGAPHVLGGVKNLLEAMRTAPATAGLVAAVPPEVQFRAVFLDRDTKTVYVDLASLPDEWENGDPIQIGLCLYSIVHTLANLGSDFQNTRFLLDDREPESSPAGYSLSEPFYPSEEWLRGQSAQ